MGKLVGVQSREREREMEREREREGEGYTALKKNNYIVLFSSRAPSLIQPFISIAQLKIIFPPWKTFIGLAR